MPAENDQGLFIVRQRSSTSRGRSVSLTHARFKRGNISAPITYYYQDTAFLRLALAIPTRFNRFSRRITVPMHRISGSLPAIGPPVSRIPAMRCRLTKKLFFRCCNHSGGFLHLRIVAGSSRTGLRDDIWHYAPYFEGENGGT